MQKTTIPSGHAMHIVIDASQGPLAQRWRVAAWGRRDGVQTPIPEGWTPPGDNPNFPWQLIYEEEQSFNSPPTHQELDWPAHNYQLTLTYEGWALRDGEQLSWDRVGQSDNDHFFVEFDRVQDDPEHNHSGHYADMSIDTVFTPPLP